MTRDEFIAEAKARGKSKEETRRKFDELEAAGKFDDSEPIKQPHGATRSFEAPTYEERVQEVADKEAVKSLESQKKDTGIANRILSPIDAFTGTVIGQINETAPYKAAGKAISWGINKLPNTPLDPLLNKAVSKVGEGIEKLPEPIKHGLNIAGDIAQLIPGVGIGGKATAKGIEAGLEGGSDVLKNTAARIQGTKVKINTPEFKKGASNEMYKKYKVFGNAKDVQKQWQSKIEDIGGKIKDKIVNSETMSDPENYTLVGDVFDKAEKTAERYGKSKTEIAEIKNQLDVIKNKFKTAYADGKINLLDAQLEKQVTGKKGDWLAKNGKITGNPESTVSSKAHNALYDALKVLVENKGSPGIKELNKQLSEMIPMERAASKQILISDRKNIMSIDDFLGGLAVASSAAHGNFLPAVIMTANVGSKSPSVAKTLYNTGNTLETLGEIGKKKITRKGLK